MMKTYGNNFITHPEQNTNDYKQPRYNNTVKSSVMHNEADNAQEKHSQAKRDKMFTERPLATKVARASYQDSNIFGTKDGQSATVQACEASGPKKTNARGSNTFNSNVFAGPSEDVARGR